MELLQLKLMLSCVAVMTGLSSCSALPQIYSNKDCCSIEVGEIINGKWKSHMKYEQSLLVEEVLIGKRIPEGVTRLSIKDKKTGAFLQTIDVVPRNQEYLTSDEWLDILCNGAGIKYRCVKVNTLKTYPRKSTIQP